MKTRLEISEQIKTLAFETGFDTVGIVPLASLEDGEEAISAWIKEGWHGTMKYLEDFQLRRKRLLQEIPNARSVVCLGVNYYQGEVHRTKSIEHEVKPHAPSPMPSAEFSGKIARYAWGKDYHQVIRKRHETFIKKIRSTLQINFQARSCVDTQPVPERFAAVQAGMGFVGKHTGLLNPQFGPWLFLSEIVTDLDLESEIPSRGDCGACTHCQTVCPTGALDQDYKIDARLCIAYLTIEHKGIIPRELRPKIKDWIFGCDECMAICPFTSKQQETSWTEFHSDQGPGTKLMMDQLFNLSSNREYEKKFAGTAVLRAGLKQMLRNACIVLGNSGSPEALPYLKKAIRHASALVRLHAAWALGQIVGKEAKALLEETLRNEKDLEVISEINRVLSERTSIASEIVPPREKSAQVEV